MQCRMAPPWARVMVSGCALALSDVTHDWANDNCPEVSPMGETTAADSMEAARSSMMP
jgi:hypothetical protein